MASAKTAKEKEATPSSPIPAVRDWPKEAVGVQGVPPETREAAVQVAALLYHRDGAEPSGAYLLRKCGQVHVEAVEKAGANPDAVATWACSEARRRSPGLEHKAIVAQRIA